MWTATSCIQVKEGDTYSFGDHTVTFVGAPMVHWPEAMVTFDTTNGVLFSADAFGSFIALDGKLFADEVNFDRDWIDEARRYLHQHRGQVQKHRPKAKPIQQNELISKAIDAQRMGGQGKGLRLLGKKLQQQAICQVYTSSERRTIFPLTICHAPSKKPAQKRML